MHFSPMTKIAFWQELQKIAALNESTAPIYKGIQHSEARAVLDKSMERRQKKREAQAAASRAEAKVNRSHGSRAAAKSRVTSTRSPATAAANKKRAGDLLRRGQRLEVGAQKADRGANLAAQVQSDPRMKPWDYRGPAPAKRRGGTPRVVPASKPVVKPSATPPTAKATSTKPAVKPAATPSLTSKVVAAMPPPAKPKSQTLKRVGQTGAALVGAALLGKGGKHLLKRAPVQQVAQPTLRSAAAPGAAALGLTAAGAYGVHRTTR